MLAQILDLLIQEFRGAHIPEFLFLFRNTLKRIIVLNIQNGVCIMQLETISNFVQNVIK